MDKTLEIIFRLLQSDNYKERAMGEYYLVKDKYLKLQSMILKRQIGALDFTPNCPMTQWLSQANAMEAYLLALEDKARYEGYEL